MILLSSTWFDKHKLRLRLSSLSVRLAKFAGFVWPLLLLAPMIVVPVRNLRMTVKIHRFLYFRFCICRLKSIKINHNRTKSIITRNCVIDFYRFPIFVDWFVLTTIDNDRILSTIGIIDMLRPESIYPKWKDLVVACRTTGGLFEQWSTKFWKKFIACSFYVTIS